MRNGHAGLGRPAHGARHVMGERPDGPDVAAGRQEEVERAIGVGIAKRRRRHRAESSEAGGELTGARGRLDVEEIGLVAIIVRRTSVVVDSAGARKVLRRRLTAAELEEREGPAGADAHGEHGPSNRQRPERSEDEGGARTAQGDLVDGPRRPAGVDEWQHERRGDRCDVVAERPGRRGEQRDPVHDADIDRERTHQRGHERGELTRHVERILAHAAAGTGVDASRKSELAGATGAASTRCPAGHPSVSSSRPR